MKIDVVYPIMCSDCRKSKAVKKVRGGRRLCHGCYGAYLANVSVDKVLSGASSNN